MRRSLMPLAVALFAVGCQPPPVPVVVAPVALPPAALTFHPSVADAKAAAARTGKPLCVFLVLGDWNRHC